MAKCEVCGKGCYLPVSRFLTPQTVEQNMEAERKACKSDCEGNSLSYVRLLQMPALRQDRACVSSVFDS